jgi:hypothetical protein
MIGPCLQGRARGGAAPQMATISFGNIQRGLNPDGSDDGSGTVSTSVGEADIITQQVAISHRDYHEERRSNRKVNRACLNCIAIISTVFDATARPSGLLGRVSFEHHIRHQTKSPTHHNRYTLQ